MPHINIEIKARTAHPEKIRAFLLAHNAKSIGTDHQIDTYFKAPTGRLKLRQGNIENSLIFYNRPDQAGPKQSDVSLFQAPANSDDLKTLLTNSLGILAMVDKHREIYFIDNVKFHIDKVVGLGSFIEIEAIDQAGTGDRDALLAQCQNYLNLLEIKDTDLLEQSYSDMLLVLS